MRLGIDLGGSKIAAVVLDDAGQEAWAQRVATPRDDYPGTLEAIAALVDGGERAAGEPCTVGVGMPGAISPATGLVKNANSTWLNGRPFHQDLERALGRAVRIANDANCLAVSEARDGAAGGADVVFGVILGTGVGGGLVVHGQVVTGANAIAGEWGHNPLPWPEDDERPGPACYCGRFGCLETWLSGPGLSADYARRGGASARAEDVVERATGAAGDRPFLGESGSRRPADPVASATLSAWESRLARGLAHVINIVDPDVIVCGGGLSRVDRLYERVPTAWGRWVFSDRVSTRLVPARFGDASGVRGAAWLWDRFPISHF
jgi:fructokinase